MRALGVLGALLIAACSDAPERPESGELEVSRDSSGSSICASVVHPEKAREAANRLLAGRYYEDSGRCYMEGPLVDGRLEYQCATVMVWLRSEERETAETVANELQGHLLRPTRRSSCSALISVDRGTELEKLRQAWALPDVLLVDMNWMATADPS